MFHQLLSESLLAEARNTVPERVGMAYHTVFELSKACVQVVACSLMDLPVRGHASSSTFISRVISQSAFDHFRTGLQTKLNDPCCTVEPFARPFASDGTVPLELRACTVGYGMSFPRFRNATIPIKVQTDQKIVSEVPSSCHCPRLASTCW
jgi:hypothetical protein